MPSYGNKYCVETPAHPSITTVCPGGFGVSPVSEIEDKARKEVSYVDSLITQLTTLSGSISGDAETLVAALSGYVADALPSVTYVAPVWTSPGIQTVADSELTITYAPSATNQVQWVSPTLNRVSEPKVSITAPTQSLPTIPDVVSGSLPTTAPAGLPAYELSVSSAPAFSLPARHIDSVQEVDLESVTFSLPNPISLDTFSLSLDYSLLDEALSRLNSIVFPESTIPDYEQLFDDIFTVAGSMISGDGPDTTLFLQDSITPRLLGASIGKRGLTAVPAAYGYDAFIGTLLSAYITDSKTLFDATYADDIVQASFKIATKAETLLIDIAVGVNDARFKRRVALAEMNLEVAKGLAAYYNGLVAELEGKVLEYNAGLTRLQLLAEAAQANARLAKATGEVNQAVGRNFAIQEKGKALDAKVFSALVASEAAKLEGMKGEIAEVEAGLAQAQVGLANYMNTTTQYSGEVARIKGVYDKYKASTLATIEQNRAGEAIARSSALELRGVASAAGAAAARAGVESIQLSRAAELAKASYVDQTNINDLAAYDVAKKLESFVVSSSEARIEAAQREVHPASVADIGKAIASFSSNAMQSAGRAAALAQQANETLARAYAAAYEVAGKAGAAIQTGKLSGYRVSATLSAASNLSASESRSDNYRSSGSLTYEDDDIANESISV